VASPFEVKLLPFIFTILGLLPFPFFFQNNDISKVIHYVAMPGGCLFFMQASIQSFRLVFREQDLKNQFQYRWGTIGMLLFIVAINYWTSPPFYATYHSPAWVLEQGRFYRPIYNMVIPLVSIAILLIRLVPLTLKYYKLKRQQKRLATEC